MRIMRQPEETNEDFLFHLYNDLGCRGLEISANQFIDRVDENGNHYTDVVWSTKYSFGELLDLSPSRWLKGTFFIARRRPFTRSEFIRYATHRTILDIEILFDIDDVWYPTIDFSSIDEKSLFIAKDLREKGHDCSVYFTGNKSYHISYLDTRLRSMTHSDRKRYREEVLFYYGADLGLSSELRTISLEGARHYKSGKRKSEVVM